MDDAGQRVGADINSDRPMIRFLEIQIFKFKAGERTSLRRIGDEPVKSFQNMLRVFSLVAPSEGGSRCPEIYKIIIIESIAKIPY